jgi:hypothetical protein
MASEARQSHALPLVLVDGMESRATRAWPTARERRQSMSESDTRALAQELARKAKELTASMLARTNRFPDAADYETAFLAILHESMRKK